MLWKKCTGDLVMQWDTSYFISHRPHNLFYKELNRSKFLYSLCTEHFRLSLATATLSTQGLLGKQIIRKTLLLSFDTVGYFSIPEPRPYNQTEKKIAHQR